METRIRTVIYARVSTDRQTAENQIRELNRVGDRLNWDIVDVITDHGISGAKGRDHRPGFNKLNKMITRREIDLVASWSVDRLSRSLVDLLQFMQEIASRQVGLYLHVQGIDTTTPGGRAVLQVMGVFAELERALIQERVRAGLDRARAEGKRLGRPPVSDRKITAVRRTLRQGHGIQKTARLVGVGVSVVQRVRNEMRA